MIYEIEYLKAGVPEVMVVQLDAQGIDDALEHFNSLKLGFLKSIQALDKNGAAGDDG